jgi:type II secretory pathway pseudopilin PulG
MRFRTLQSISSGFSLVEVIIVASLMVLVFGGLFGSFQYSLRVINLSRAKLSAISIANERMEYFRSLPYSDVGVLAGFPLGTIPQVSTSTLNGIEFTERVRVDYVDDPADGLGAADGNAITTDYKQIRLTHSWEIGGVSGEITMLSNLVPRSVETNVGGGSVRINVLDADSALLPGASVNVRNAALGYNVTSFSDVTGSALFSVPAGSGYEVSVTGPIAGREYSTDGTYEATTTNPNPISAPFAVLEADVSTLTFQIGRLSDLRLSLKETITDNFFVEDFSSLALVASSTRVVSTGAQLSLVDVAGVYESTGMVYLGPVAPATVSEWYSLRLAATNQPDTTARARVYTGPAVGPYTLVPDTDLPGNSTGFTDLLIDLSTVDAALYPSLIIGIELTTSNSAVSPLVDEVVVAYRESHTPAAAETYVIRGNKTVGTDSSSIPIYKYVVSTTTDGDGENNFSDLEFDTYTLDFGGGYDVAVGCPQYPIVHQAGIESVVELLLVPNLTRSLRLSVVDAAGQVVPGAEAVLTRSGYSETRTTGGCGQAFFPGAATTESDFQLNITAAGYQNRTISGVVIDGDSFLEVTLAAL